MPQTAEGGEGLKMEMKFTVETWLREEMVLRIRMELDVRMELQVEMGLKADICVLAEMGFWVERWSSVWEWG